MTDEERIDRFLALAVKTGRILVSKDVWDALVEASPHSVVQGNKLCLKQLGEIEVFISPHLSANTALACDLLGHPVL